MSDPRPLPSPPEGFALMQRKGAFWKNSGPYFHRQCEDGAEQAFFATEDHCNAQGEVHGGMLSAFLDGLCAHAVRRAAGGVPTLTVHLSIDFLTVAKAGEWVVGEAHVTQAGRGIVFVEGRLHSNDRTVLRGNGVFKVGKLADGGDA
jgi:uncharacterized protein (TIGR00369 family)